MTIDISLSTSLLDMMRRVVIGLADTNVCFLIKVKMGKFFYVDSLTTVECITRIIVPASFG